MIKVGRVGTWTGRAWYLPMALLFIPVSRNSPFLRLVNLPYEHAVRLHRWLGHFSLVILLLHSITFSLHIYYTGGGSVKGVSTTSLLLRRLDFDFSCVVHGIKFPAVMLNQ